MERIDTLISMYPALAGDIQTAASAGHSPDEIQASIGRFTENLRSQGLGPAEVYQHVTGEALGPAPQPSIGARIGQAALRGLTLGFAGAPPAPDPYESFLKTAAIEEGPSFLANLIPFKAAGKLVQASGLPAVAGNLARQAGVPAAVDVGTWLGKQLNLPAGVTKMATGPAIENIAREGLAMGGINLPSVLNEQANMPAGERSPGQALQEVLLQTLLGGTMGALGAAGHAQPFRPRYMVKGPPEPGFPQRFTPPETTPGEPSPMPEMARGKDNPVYQRPAFDQGLNTQVEDILARLRAGEQPLIQREAWGEAPGGGAPTDLGAQRATIIEDLKNSIQRVSELKQIEGQDAADAAKAQDAYIAQRIADLNALDLQSQTAQQRMNALGAKPFRGTPSPAAKGAAEAAAAPSVGTPEQVPTVLPKAQVLPSGKTPENTETTRPATTNPTVDPPPLAVEKVPLETADARAVALRSRGSQDLSLLQTSPTEATIVHRPVVPPLVADPKAQPAVDPVSSGWDETRIKELKKTLADAGIKFVERLKNELDPDSPIMGWEVQPGRGFDASRELPGKLFKTLDDVKAWWEPDKVNARSAELPTPAGVIAGVDDVTNGGQARPTNPRDLAIALYHAGEEVHPYDLRMIAARYVGEKSPQSVSNKNAQGIATIMSGGIDLHTAQLEYVKLSAAAKTPKEKAMLKKAIEARGQDDALMPIKKRMTEDGSNIFVCASPCEPMPPGMENLSEDARKQAEFLLGLGQGIQMPVELAKQGFINGLFSWWKGAPGAYYRTPSEVARASKSAGAWDIVTLGDDIVRQTERFDHGVAEYANKFMKIKKGTPEDFQVALIMTTPEMRNNAKFMASQSQAVQDAVTYLTKYFDHTASLRNMRPEELMADYFPHVFDRGSIRQEAARLIEAINSGQLPPGMDQNASYALYKQLESVIGKIDAGEAINYNQLPYTFKNKFFEERHGVQGYSLSAVKAFETYHSFFKNKQFIEPYLQRFADNIRSIEAEGNPDLAAYMKKYVLQLTGLERTNTPGGFDKVASVMRSLEFARTIGSFNIGAALKNMGQHLFSALEGGAESFVKGAGMALEANSKADSASGKYLHGLIDTTGTLKDVAWWEHKSTSPAQSAIQKFTEVSGKLFNIVETGNRKVSFFTGLHSWFKTAEGKKFGVSFEDALRGENIPMEAVDFATDFVRKTQFRYGKADMPLALRGPIAGTVFQYASFQIKAAEMLWRWASQEGAAGRQKLATLALVGVTGTALADLAGADVSSYFGTPFDFLNAVRAGQDIKKEDWPGAAQHMAKAAVGGLLENKFGPVASMVQHATGIASGALEGKDTSKRASNFFWGDIMPSQAKKMVEAWQNFMAAGDEGSKAQLVSAIAGLPNREQRMRLAYLQALQEGHPERAQDLRKVYMDGTGGQLHVDMAATLKATQASIQARQDKARTEASKPYLDRLRAKVPPHLARLIP